MCTIAIKKFLRKVIREFNAGQKLLSFCELNLDLFFFSFMPVEFKSEK